MKYLTNTTVTDEICEVVQEYLPISRNCQSREVGPEPRPEYYNHPTEEIETTSDSYTTEETNSRTTAALQPDKLGRKSELESEGGSDNSSARREGREDQIKQSGGYFHGGEEDSTGSSVGSFNPSFSFLITLLFFAQAVL